MKKTSRFSTSFSGEEIMVADDLFRILLRGGDPKLLLRSGGARKLMAKFSRLAVSVQTGLPVQEPTEQIVAE